MSSDACSTKTANLSPVRRSRRPEFPLLMRPALTPLARRRRTFPRVLIPGCRYSLKGRTNRREMSFLSIERDLAIEPGETKDLGTLQFGKNGKPIKR